MHITSSLGTSGQVTVVGNNISIQIVVGAVTYSKRLSSVNLALDNVV